MSDFFSAAQERHGETLESIYVRHHFKKDAEHPEELIEVCTKMTVDSISLA